MAAKATSTTAKAHIPLQLVSAYLEKCTAWVNLNLWLRWMKLALRLLFPEIL